GPVHLPRRPVAGPRRDGPAHAVTGPSSARQSLWTYYDRRAPDYQGDVYKRHFDIDVLIAEVGGEAPSAAAATSSCAPPAEHAPPESVPAGTSRTGTLTCGRRFT